MNRTLRVKKTLLIDGENLFKIGLFGVKDYYHNEKHVIILLVFDIVSLIQ